MELDLEQWLIIISAWLQFLAAKSEDFWKPRKKYIQGRLLKKISQLGSIPFSQPHRME